MFMPPVFGLCCCTCSHSQHSHLPSSSQWTSPTFQCHPHLSALGHQQCFKTTMEISRAPPFVRMCRQNSQRPTFAVCVEGSPKSTIVASRSIQPHTPSIFIHFFFPFALPVAVVDDTLCARDAAGEVGLDPRPDLTALTCLFCSLGVSWDRLLFLSET